MRQDVEPVGDDSIDDFRGDLVDLKNSARKIEIARILRLHAAAEMFDFPGDDALRLLRLLQSLLTIGLGYLLLCLPQIDRALWRSTDAQAQ